MGVQKRRIELPLYNGGYKGDSPYLNSFVCKNLYPETLVGEATSQITLVGTPGLRLVKVVGAGPHRGAILHEGTAFFVSGTELIEMDINQNLTTRGTLSTSSGIVSMSSNGDTGGQLTITDGAAGYTWNGTTFATISDPQFPALPTKNVFMEGYTIILRSTSPKFALSDFYDSSAYAGSIAEGQAERDPDNILALVVYDRQVWFLGEVTAEPWFNSGDTLPFSPVLNGFIEWGILAPDSVQNAGDNGLIWLAKNRYGVGEVIKVKGYEAKPIVPYTILQQWRTYGDLSTAYSFVYQEHGHVFYQITFPSAEKTWVYDCKEEMWHERSSKNILGEEKRHRASSYVNFNNLHLVGDYANGNVYELDMDTFTDNGEAKLWEFTTFHINDLGQDLKHNFIRLEGETGVGITSGQGSNPTVAMFISDNGGRTFGNVRKLKWGKEGEFYRYANWPMLGQPKDRVYKFQGSDPIKWRFKRLLLDFQERNN